MAHELGNDQLCKEIALFKGYQEFELFDMTHPTEYEANLFAAELRIGYDELLELLNDDDKSFFDVARELYIPVDLLDFKFCILKYKGYRLEAPFVAHSVFLKSDMDSCYDEED